MKRVHAMPFGAQIEGDDTRFRLWAPGAMSVELELAHAAGHTLIRMAADADGWCEARVQGAGGGTRYRYRVDGELRVPDPASRCNPTGVHHDSEVIDPAAFDWQDAAWRGRPWEQAVIYELHVGALTPPGNFDGVRSRLDYLAELGVTALELMPLAEFPGRRGWGYDGVLPFAPKAAYGRPEALKTLVQEAHARGLMVLLDVVYNHFGPDGNYLGAYAPDFFNPRHQTPWGAAINFDAPGSAVVRDFFIHNALYWLEEYHFDGLRLDAVHAIADDSTPHFIDALTAAVHAGPGRERHVHLILENDQNQARYLGRDAHGQPTRATAQWNDDFHHAAHVLATGETDGYYADYATAPLAQLARCLAEGFAYQDDASVFRGGEARGEPSAALSPLAFVDALQTHDQVGNRAFGERLCQLAPLPAVEALTEVFLLAPQPPMLFMGEEFAAATPFLYFCDFTAELARAVTDGRRREFERFERFADPQVRESIPDPNADATFARSVLDWPSQSRAPHARMLALYRRLLGIRQARLVPLLAGIGGHAGRYEISANGALAVDWQLGDGGRLALVANLTAAPLTAPVRPGEVLHLSEGLTAKAHAAGELPAWSVAWTLEPGACSPERAPPAQHNAAIVPRATYRLQFNSAFTLADATALVPYLAELGISHCYASPYLRARPGSTHGYDIVDHNAINPEIGSREDLERFVETLAGHGMGHILDMVPNHMGVMGADNAWWLDVLENGEASVYADYFDIDWRPLNPQLHGKVLLPLLGDHYGSVLARGELQLAFNAERGEFDIGYFEHRLPIDPAEYPRIVGHGIERLADALGAGNEHLLELQSLLTAFGNLPSRHGIDASRRAERDRDKEIHKRRLAALAAAEPAIQRHIADCVAALNGDPQDPDSFDGLHGLIRAQAWRAAYWRVAADDINYRRFFDINDLAGLRMENPAVFDATHRLVLELIGAGKLHGLRIDHPDGLYDPRGYFGRLQGAVREQTGAAPAESPDALPLYLVVEKILAEHERLPDDWPVHGTTGYHFANQVNGLFVDTAAQRRMGRIYADFVRAPDAFDELVYQCKRLIMRTSLASELGVLATRLARIAAASRHTCDFTQNSLRSALGEVVACFPVYRSYLVDGVASTDDRRHIEWAVAVARRRSQAADVSIFDFVRDVLTADIGAGKGDAYRADVNAFAMKLQQFSAPVTAKGLEDTAFYRYHRLCSLNEVGADPRRFGVSVAAFHAATRARHKRWPHEMLASSTHDSKRAEDVRARLNVLSELPAAWKLTAQRWRRLNRSRKRLVDDTPAPSANDEYLLYQTLIGSYPLAAPDAEELADYRTRVAAYMQKAVREAKQHSSWVNVNADYEAALAGFIDALLTPADSNLFLPEFAAAAQRLAGHGLRNSLAQTLIKLTAPGVPDLYQGSELWQFHLVDPDNRRPVDYDRRRALLSEVKALPSPAPGGFVERLRPLLDDPTDGRIKLYLTWRTLQLRSRWPDVFRDGDYAPLTATGAGAAHVVAYARRLGQRSVVVLVPRLLTRMAGGRDEAASAPDWGDTRIELPPAGDGDWHDVLTGRALTPDADGALGVGESLSGCPVALLVSDAALPADYRPSAEVERAYRSTELA